MALRVDHQVGRLDIALDDALGVRMAQGLPQLVDDGQSARNGQALAGHQRLVQIVALHQFHDDVGQPAVTPLVEHLHDVRVMRQDAGQLAAMVPGQGGEVGVGHLPVAHHTLPADRAISQCVGPEAVPGMRCHRVQPVSQAKAWRVEG